MTARKEPITRTMGYTTLLPEGEYFGYWYGKEVNIPLVGGSVSIETQDRSSTRKVLVSVTILPNCECEVEVI